MEGDVPINCQEGGESACNLSSSAKVIFVGSFRKKTTTAHISMYRKDVDDNEIRRKN